SARFAQRPGRVAIRAGARRLAGAQGGQRTSEVVPHELSSEGRGNEVSDRPVVSVAAAVLTRGDGKVLLAQRLQGTPYPGYWEFPGGKLEPGESAASALKRELQEELGISVSRASPWLTQRYEYPHAHVELNFFRVFAWKGEPHGRDGQAIAWQTPGAFDVAPLL